MADQLARILDTGLGWLFDTVQPDDAHQHHLGITLGLPEANRIYGFGPTGAENLPVVWVEVAKPELQMYGPPLNPLAPDELFDLAQELERRGHTVRTTWNGHPGTGGSIGLVQPAHPTLVAAVDRYRRGCTIHPARSVFCDCEHWNAGFRRVVQPERPAPTP